MSTTTVIVIVVVLVLLLAGVAAAVVSQRRKRSAALEGKFGPEYHRTVEETEDRRSAEKELREREKRRAGLQVTPLSATSAGRYREEWDRLQMRFVDDPGDSVEQADRLVVRMMRECGYPMDDFEQRASDISVDHPDVAQHYRDAHAVAVAHSQGTADTEQLRRALTSYRHLVGALLRDSESTGSGSAGGTD